MDFFEQLAAYADVLGCSNKKLAQLSGLSEATISRYRKGERVPKKGSEQVDKLARGMSAFALQVAQEATPSAPSFSYETIYEAFDKTLLEDETSVSFGENLDSLITVLRINVNNLARALNFDASYISRIRNKQRQPSDMASFARGVSRFVVKNYSAEELVQTLSALTGCSKEDFADADTCTAALGNWLCSGVLLKNDRASDFLVKLDTFDLEDYLRLISFDKAEVSPTTARRPKSKTYRGIAELRQGELDFLSATLLSESRADVTMYSDMPAEDMVTEKGFMERYMLGIAALLKRGLRLNVIHNLDRPFEEMMLGLEVWIPLYMTGLVSPFYLRGALSSAYFHLNYASGAAAMQGEGIAGHHDRAQYRFITDDDDLAYYQEKTALLLDKAYRLMDIYRENTREAYQAFLSADAASVGTRYNVLTTLPLYTLPEVQLEGILAHNGVAGKEREAICAFARNQRARAERILADNMIHDEVPLLGEEEFTSNPLKLPLSDIFYEADILYDYKDYLAHREALQEYAAAHANYSFQTRMTPSFNNIQIEIREGEWVKVSKAKSPAIHFVIKHPKLRAALEDMMLAAGA